MPAPAHDAAFDDGDVGEAGLEQQFGGAGRGVFALAGNENRVVLIGLQLRFDFLEAGFQLPPRQVEGAGNMSHAALEIPGRADVDDDDVLTGLEAFVQVAGLDEGNAAGDQLRHEARHQDGRHHQEDEIKGFLVELHGPVSVEANFISGAGSHRNRQHRPPPLKSLH